ncbi:MAG TPA: radical SAM protein [Anaerolineales bacterium]|nr:radical SAM protein [Anaerolineales bacterium]
MQVTFIKPTLGCLQDGQHFVDEARMEPLSLGILAGLTPPGVDCRLVDDRIDTIDFDDDTDLVAINVETFTARRAYEIADEYRKRGIRVVMGGMHATLLPDEVAQHADSVFTGDAETLWPQVVADAHAGRLRPLYHGECGVPQPGVLPRRDLYAGKGYLPISLIQFGRGCRHHCEFCAVGQYFDHHQCTRPIDEVVAEIQAQRRRDLFFIDDNLISDPQAAKALLRALIPLDVRWVSQASVEQTLDDELMDLFVESGCLGNVIGFESLDIANVLQMGKSPNRSAVDGYATTLAALSERHLQTWAAFILGYDNDDVESMLSLCEWGIAQRFTFAAFNVLMPYPSTPLYTRLKEEDRLLYDGNWWLHPAYRFNYAAFRPKRMTADELTEAGWTCRQRWSSMSSILRRALDLKTNMSSLLRFALYCAYNPLFRRESFKKQGMRLGLR